MARHHGGVGWTWFAYEGKSFDAATCLFEKDAAAQAID
jgi:hypothetical protein